MLLSDDANFVNCMSEHPESESDQEIRQDFQNVNSSQKCSDSENQDNLVRRDMELSVEYPEHDSRQEESACTQEVTACDKPAFFLPPALLLKKRIQRNDEQSTREREQSQSHGRLIVTGTRGKQERKYP